MTRFFPATALGGRLHPHGIAVGGPWDSERLTYTPEEAVNELLSAYALVGDRKAGTREEILGASTKDCAGQMRGFASGL